jgi:hypothetical protein
MSDLDQVFRQNNAAIKSASHEWMVANTRLTNIDVRTNRSQFCEWMVASVRMAPRRHNLLIAPDSVRAEVYSTKETSNLLKLGVTDGSSWRSKTCMATTTPWSKAQ